MNHLVILNMDIGGVGAESTSRRGVYSHATARVNAQIHHGGCLIGASNSLTPLRVCRKCGLEAYNEEDLEKFSKSKRLPYGHDNICKPCHNALYRKGGKYFFNKALYREKRRGLYPNKIYEENLRWKTKNPDKVKAVSMRAMFFNGREVYCDENPRTNICTRCLRSYPEELIKQTSVHHWYYDLADVLAGTQELCISCHPSLPRTRWVEPCNGENCTVVKYDANLFKNCPKCGAPNPIWNKEEHEAYLAKLKIWGFSDGVDSLANTFDEPLRVVKQDEGSMSKGCS